MLQSTTTVKTETLPFFFRSNADVTFLHSLLPSPHNSLYHMFNTPFTSPLTVHRLFFFGH